MRLPALQFGLWMGVVVIILVLGAYAIWRLRGYLMHPDEDSESGDADLDDSPLYTTAEIDRLKREGEIDQIQYERLKAEALAAAKRRAERAHNRRRKQGKDLLR